MLKHNQIRQKLISGWKIRLGQWVKRNEQKMDNHQPTDKTNGQKWTNEFTPYSPHYKSFDTFTCLIIDFCTNQMGSHGGTSRHYGNCHVKFCPKTMAKQIWPAILCCATVSTLSYDSALYSVQLSGLPWWHKPLLWQQWRKKTIAKQVWPSIPFLSHRFNTVTWLNIDFSTNPVGCYGGTSTRYGNNDIIFCPKTKAKTFWPPKPICAMVSVPSHDLATISPKIQLVAMVPQAVVWQQWQNILSKNHAQAILTAYSLVCHGFDTVTRFSIKLSTNPVGCHGGTIRGYGNNDVMFCPKSFPSKFEPLFFVVPPFQHSHMTQHRILHKPSGWSWWRKPSLWQQRRNKTIAKQVWPSISFWATVSTLSHDSTSNSP